MLYFGRVDDVYVTDDAEKPMSGGIFTMVKADEPFVYTYKVRAAQRSMEFLSRAVLNHTRCSTTS